MNESEFYTVPGMSHLDLAKHCGHIASRKIERFINSGKAQSMNVQKGNLVNKQSFSKNKLVFATEKKRKQTRENKANFFSFSNCDKEEITSLAALILAKANAFPAHLGPYAIEKRLIDDIKEAIKGRDGLELNRYRNKKKVHIGIRGESVAGIMDCDIASLPELHDKLMQSPYSDKQEKIISVFSEKSQAIEKCLIAFHQASESRQWKSTLKSDCDFFRDLQNLQCTGHGKSRTAFIERRKEFMHRLQQGFLILKKSEKSEFKSFEEFAAIF
jgi:hypothetical protein